MDLLDTQSSDELTTYSSMKKIKMEMDHIAEEVPISNLQLYKDQIHVAVELMDILEIGGMENVLNMTDVIKLAQLTVKYFFWSLAEKSI